MNVYPLRRLGGTTGWTGPDARGVYRELVPFVLLSAATALNPYIGYDRATEIVKEAAASGRSLREVAREQGVDDEILDKALDYRAMAKPHQ